MEDAMAGQGDDRTHERLASFRRWMHRARHAHGATRNHLAVAPHALAAARTPKEYPESQVPAPEDRSPPEVPNSG